jgi:L-rhamnose mutarotase
MERMAFRMNIKPGSEPEYLRRHEQIWPEMLEALRAAGFRNYSIHRDGTTLFAIFESENVRATLAAIVADPVNARWAAMMSDILLTETDSDTSFVPALPEMFYFKG